MAHFIVINIKDDADPENPGKVKVHTEWSEGLPMHDVLGILDSTLKSLSAKHQNETATADIVTPDGKAIHVDRNGGGAETPDTNQEPNHVEA